MKIRGIGLILEGIPAQHAVHSRYAATSAKCFSFVPLKTTPIGKRPAVIQQYQVEPVNFPFPAGMGRAFHACEFATDDGFAGRVEQNELPGMRAGRDVGQADGHRRAGDMLSARPRILPEVSRTAAVMPAMASGGNATAARMRAADSSV